MPWWGHSSPGVKNMTHKKQLQRHVVAVNRCVLALNLGVVPGTAPSQHTFNEFFRGLALRPYLLERMACPLCAVSQSVTKPECPVKANVALRRSSSDDTSKLATALRAPSSPAHTKPRWSGSTLILRGCMGVHTPILVVSRSERWMAV